MAEPRTQATRIKDLEGYAIRHGEAIGDLAQRIASVEDVQRKAEIKEAREEGDWKAVLKQLQSLDLRLGKIEGYGGKALGSFIFALIGAFVVFLVRGGLA